MNRIERHREICENLNKTYEQKNSDYGNSFGETFKKLGIISAITRISDKYNRICSLATKSAEERKVKDESIKDTLLDMANYCIMTVIEIENENAEKTEEDKKETIGTSKWIINSDGYYPYCYMCGHESKTGKLEDFCSECGREMMGTRSR